MKIFFIGFVIGQKIIILFPGQFLGDVTQAAQYVCPVIRLNLNYYIQYLDGMF
jgi:hypothetical protein